jgi:NitT/TauT family transport system permease protein
VDKAKDVEKPASGPGWFWRALEQYGPAIVTVVLLLTAWQLATLFWAIPKWLLPSPVDISLAAWKWKALLLKDTWITLGETLAGFVAALVTAVPFAAVLVSSPVLWRALYPILAGLQSIPKNAIAPLLIVWLGTGLAPKVAISFLIAFFPILVNAVTGMSQIDADVADMVKSLRANQRHVFWHLRLPNGLPYIFAACKVAITLALVGAVIGEFVAADAGLGQLILVSSSQLDTDVAFVAITLLALIGMVLFSLVGAVERLATPWCVAMGEDLPGSSR